MMQKCLLILLLFTVCACKKDKAKQIGTSENLCYDNNNHPALEIPIGKYLTWVDSTLGVKNIRLVDYRNQIYQYNGISFYWNKKYDYSLAYPSTFEHGEEPFLCDGNRFVNKDSTIYINVYATYFDSIKDDYPLQEWFNKMIDSETEQGNVIESKNVKPQSYIIKGKTKVNKHFYSKAIFKMAYEREVIVTVWLEYEDSEKMQAREIINKHIEKFPYNPLRSNR